MIRVSISDSFISAMTSIRLMDENISDDHELRHTIRHLKRCAENILSNAAGEAEDLARAAINLISDFERERADAIVQSMEKPA